MATIEFKLEVKKHGRNDVGKTTAKTQSCFNWLTAPLKIKNPYNGREEEYEKNGYLYD